MRPTAPGYGRRLTATNQTKGRRETTDSVSNAAYASSSWPGLSRLSMSPLAAQREGVDGRGKRGHDRGGVIFVRFGALVLPRLPAARSSGPCLLECQAVGEDRVVTSLDLHDETRLQCYALLAREVRRVAGARQQPLHLARPVPSLDLDQRLQFVQMVDIAQRAQHTFQRVVGLPVVVHDNAGDTR
jgi:hypothetical protein